MDLLKSELDENFSALGFRSLRRNLRVLDQKGTSVNSRDKKRDALAPGKRVSKTGKVYWETRKNRSDALGKNI